MTMKVTGTIPFPAGWNPTPEDLEEMRVSLGLETIERVVEHNTVNTEEEADACSGSTTKIQGTLVVSDPLIEQAILTGHRSGISHGYQSPNHLAETNIKV